MSFFASFFSKLHRIIVRIKPIKSVFLLILISYRYSSFHFSRLEDTYFWKMISLFWPWMFPYSLKICKIGNNVSIRFWRNYLQENSILQIVRHIQIKVSVPQFASNPTKLGIIWQDSVVTLYCECARFSKTL